MELFHGSPDIVETPQIALCKKHNDYGPGFYCTLSKELACEWACKVRGRDGFVNRYRLREEGLVYLDLEQEPYTVCNWLALLFAHRTFDCSVNRGYLEGFIDKYGVNLEGVDVVHGYRADDSYFSIAKGFVNGMFTIEHVEQMLHLGHLGTQVVLVSQAAFDCLDFEDVEMCQARVWYPLWMGRDMSARAEFQKMASSGEGSTGHRIYDLVEM